MRNLKKIIIIVLILIVILSVIGLFIWKKYEGKPLEDFASPEGDQKIVQKTVSRVSKNIDYYTAKNIIDNYIYGIISQDNDLLYNILDPKVYNELNINKENIVSKLNNNICEENDDIENYKFIVDDMYFMETEGNIVYYFVYGKVMNKLNQNFMDTSVVIEEDTINDTYYVLPYEYIKNKKYYSVKEGDTYDVSDIEKIEDNSKNEIEYQNLDEYTIILNLMADFTDKLVYGDLEDSYKLFSDEYKKARFNTLDEYNSYINNNLEGIFASSIKKYKINEYDDYTEYICVDQYGNYYIFDETAVMKYTVRLDTYTIDSDEFLNKYNNGSEQLKVGMNLEKVFQALNRKDYQYIYEKLYPEFRENNFPTLNNFKEYMQNEFFEINKITYGEFESKSNIDIYDVYITDAREDEEEADTKKVEKSFILKLGEGTDFEMSFNIQ